MAENLSRRRWFRFTLGQLLIFSIGFGIGLGTLRFWQFERHIPVVSVRVQVFEMHNSQAQTLGVTPEDGSSSNLVTKPPTFCSQLAVLEKNKTIRSISAPTLVIPTGYSGDFSLTETLSYPPHPEDGIAPTTSHSEDYGIQVHVEPKLLANGNVRLNLRPKFTVPDVYQSTGTRSLEIDAGWDCPRGESVVVYLGKTWSPDGDIAGAFVVVATPTVQKSP